MPAKNADNLISETSLKRWIAGGMATVLAAIGVAGPDNALAQDSTPMLLNFNVGEVGVLDSLGEPLRFGVDLRFRPMTSWLIAPAIGAALAENGARFLYVEARRDFRLSQNWMLTPSFGVGTFDDGEGLRLGSDIEFRSGIEASYVFDSGNRVGLSFYHLSNGGLANRNPGTEAVVLAVHLPIGR